MQARLLQVDLFDMMKEESRIALNNLLGAENVLVDERHVMSTPEGGCKVLLFYYITDPGRMQPPPPTSAARGGYSMPGGDSHASS